MQNLSHNAPKLLNLSSESLQWNAKVVQELGGPLAVPEEVTKLMKDKKMNDLMKGAFAAYNTMLERMELIVTNRPDLFPDKSKKHEPKGGDGGGGDGGGGAGVGGDTAPRSAVIPVV